ncbi:hypothetical protein AWZ03_001349 [Drosophila navojoa]|uniref:Uncharacterized protein n=1 Tax=Drosophila navojoa TaxID=7232 RepID=A0A484BTF5_DRONA|nr:hypothetical protein AWZ03_001349 [Drosophila navojoa]
MATSTPTSPPAQLSFQQKQKQKQKKQTATIEAAAKPIQNQFSTTLQAAQSQRPVRKQQCESAQLPQQQQQQQQQLQLNWRACQRDLS